MKALGAVRQKLVRIIHVDFYFPRIVHEVLRHLSDRFSIRFLPVLTLYICVYIWTTTHWEFLQSFSFLMLGDDRIQILECPKTDLLLWWRITGLYTLQHCTSCIQLSNTLPQCKLDIDNGITAWKSTAHGTAWEPDPRITHTLHRLSNLSQFTTQRHNLNMWL